MSTLTQPSSTTTGNVDRLVGRQGQRATAADVEPGPVPRAHDYAFLWIEVALGERPVVVGAAVLDGAELAVEVEDADRDGARSNDLHRPRRELVHRSHVH